MNKYRNRKTVIQGHVFDSKKEAERYIELVLLQKAKKIDCLEIQPKFRLQPGFTDVMGNKHRPITYIADFSYLDLEKGKKVIEDVKGVKTEAYKIKKKLLLFLLREAVFIEI